MHDYLRIGGEEMIQTIAIAEDRFDRYRADSDFLREHIFSSGINVMQVELGRM